MFLRYDFVAERFLIWFEESVPPGKPLQHSINQTMCLDFSSYKCHQPVKLKFPNLDSNTDYFRQYHYGSVFLISRESE